MAEAFARIHGTDQFEAYSAGSKPSGKINPNAIEAMNELNYDLTTHHSKSLDDIPDGPYDAVVTMGCGDACPWIPAEISEDWEIPDPKEMNENDFNAVRDLIENKVKDLLVRLNR